jgi:hypothetical protein
MEEIQNKNSTKEIHWWEKSLSTKKYGAKTTELKQMS